MVRRKLPPSELPLALMDPALSPATSWATPPPAGVVSKTLALALALAAALGMPLAFGLVKTLLELARLERRLERPRAASSPLSSSPLLNRIDPSTTTETASLSAFMEAMKKLGAPGPCRVPPRLRR